MNSFISVRDGIANECYITRVTEDSVYYGHFIPAHENKAETAVMSKPYYNKLVGLKGFSDRYIIGEVEQ